MSKKVLVAGTCILLLVALTGGVLLNSYRLVIAPDVTFRIIDGRRVSMQELRGRPVLVTFWATSCTICRKEMPHLISLYNELSEQGLEIIGVAMAYDPPNQVLELTRLNNVPYAIALDLDGSVARAFNDVRFTPTSLLIAPDGRIITHNVGALNMTKLRAQISDMLKQSQVTSHKVQGTDNNSGA